MTLTQSKATAEAASLFLSLEIGTIVALWAGSAINEVKIASAIAAGVAVLVAIILRIYNGWALQATKSRRLTAIRIALTTATCIFLVSQTISRTWAIIACFTYWLVLVLGITLEKRQSGKIAKSTCVSILGPLMLIISFGIAAGHTVRDSVLGTMGSLVFVLAGAVGTTFIDVSPGRKIKLVNSDISKGRIAQSAVFGFLYILLLAASWRSDFLTWVEGSAFHWSYFAGPASEYQTNAWHLAANQYSPLITFISSRLSDNTWRGIYVSQAVLYTTLVLAIASITWPKSGIARLTGVALCYLLLFADPGGVGPQAFPSSGLMRFFPVYLYSAAILFAAKSNRNQAEQGNRSCNCISSPSDLLKYLAVIVGFCWSAESWLALSGAFAITLMSEVLNTLIRNVSMSREMMQSIPLAWPRSSVNKAPGQIRQFYSSILIASFWLFGFMAIGGTSAYPLSYMAKRYGWVEPQGWITLSVILCAGSCLQVALLQRDNISLTSTFMIAGVAMTTGYVSYRPVSNNITAILPVLAILMVVSACRYTREDYQAKGIIRSILRTGLCFLIGGIVSMFVFQILGLNKLLEQIRGYENRPFDLTSAACIDGDASLSKLTSELGIDINYVRQGTGKLALLDSNGFNLSVGLCHRHNMTSYHPFVLQPIQLYLDPLDSAKASERINHILEARNVSTLYLIVRNDITSEALLPIVESRIPRTWKLINQTKHLIDRVSYQILTFAKVQG